MCWQLWRLRAAELCISDNVPFPFCAPPLLYYNKLHFFSPLFFFVIHLLTTSIVCVRDKVYRATQTKHPNYSVRFTGMMFQTGFFFFYSRFIVIFSFSIISSNLCGKAAVSWTPTSGLLQNESDCLQPGFPIHDKCTESEFLHNSSVQN